MSLKASGGVTLMVTYDIWASEREKAEVLPCGLRVGRGDNPIVARIWAPKGKNPYVHFRYRSIEEREASIAKYVAAHVEAQAEKVRRREERKGSPADMEKVKPGLIFVNSWGYDQTNVDFYEVVEVKGQTVILRPIGGESVGAAGFMCDHVVARPGHFCGDPIKKRVYFYGGQPYVSMEFGSCCVWDGSPHYRSWYA